MNFSPTTMAQKSLVTQLVKSGHIMGSLLDHVLVADEMVEEVEKKSFGKLKTKRIFPNAYQVLPPPQAFFEQDAETQKMKTSDVRSYFRETPIAPRLSSGFVIEPQPEPMKIGMYSRMFDDREVSLDLQRRLLDKPPAQLQRRPLAPSRYLGHPLNYVSSESVAVQPTRPKLRKFLDYINVTLTTFPSVDDPLNPHSFYHFNYPLIMRTVPPRHYKRLDGSSTSVINQEYTAISPTPDTYDWFFDELPHSELESIPDLRVFWQELENELTTSRLHAVRSQLERLLYVPKRHRTVYDSSSSESSSSSEDDTADLLPFFTVMRAARNFSQRRGLASKK